MDKVKNLSLKSTGSHLKELEVDQNKKFTQNPSKPKFQWPRRFLFFLALLWLHITSKDVTALSERRICQMNKKLQHLKNKAFYLWEIVQGGTVPPLHDFP